MNKYIDKIKEDREYPLHLRNDTFSIEKAENTNKFDYWARIPVAST
ncbi:MAG: hypothetical protein BTN85_1206 [Candidatus Methanohalarchaeum thermophilum]|uniref:Uncharacterized protein n=1 Tax=Methanohalarchaeum thermophilum TaxID=1903181 RepID=A0A1Q6DWJ8_METT1|nr:MAG: hypothetical protein BTN85_1206 [Candidatus Methanohalarchaeum thermophilum]